jgi:hypothetical protein
MEEFLENTVYCVSDRNYCKVRFFQNCFVYTPCIFDINCTQDNQEKRKEYHSTQGLCQNNELSRLVSCVSQVTYCTFLVSSLKQGT